MEHLDEEDVRDLMPCELVCSQLESNGWAFWSIEHNDELDYLRSIKSINSVVPIFPTEKWRILHVLEKIIWSPNISLVQFWAPIKINGSTFLSTADQPFAFYNEIDKRLSSYRKLCLDSLTIDNEIPFGPPGRVFSRCLPEYNPDVSSYSSAEFPVFQTAIPLENHSYYAFPVSNFHDEQCVGVFEIVSTQPSLGLPSLIQGLDFESVGLYVTNPLDILFEPLNLRNHERLTYIKGGLYEILERHSLPFAQIWTSPPQCGSLKVLYRAAASIYKPPKPMYHEFEYSSEVCHIESGKALVGKAFASQGSCFCKDVTLLSIEEYPLVPGARKARFTQSFAICLQSKCSNNFICVVEYFLPPNEMVVRDTKTLLNMLLSTMKEQYPGFIVAPGNELGQRMLVEVLKVSPSDELGSFEIGQTLPSVQSLQDGGETTEIDSFCQQSNLQKENNVVAALLVPSCSSDKRDSLNCEGTVEVDPSLPHPIEEAVTNRGTVNVDVAHDDHIEDTTEIMQLDSHFEIGQTLLNVQSLQDGGETTEIDSFCQQSNLQNRENNVAAALLVPSCSSDKRDSLNCEGTVEVDPSLPHPIEEAVTNRGTVNVDVAHDDHIEDTTEIMQLDSHFEQPNLDTNSAGNATTNNNKIHSHKKNTIRRIEKDYGITRKKLEQRYGMTCEDAAKDLGVSTSTLKRICREYEITRWPNYKTRKVNVHVSQEKGTEYLGNKRSPATGVSRDGVMTLKVTYRGDIIKFQLSLLSTRVELEGEVEKRFKISLERFSIKYQDEDDDWILITTDSDLIYGMHSLRLSGQTTMRLLVNPEADS